MIGSHDMAKTNLCQSCGMPIDKNTLGGKNTDGTISTTYCENCYQDGEFVQDLPFDEMHAYNYEKFLASDMNKIENFFVKHMYTKKFMRGLDRWKSLRSR